MDFTFKNFIVFFVFVTASNVVFEIIAHIVRMHLFRKEAKRIQNMVAQAETEQRKNSWH